VTFPDSELSSDPPQKRYMGVRVKMPVRELLRKIRLSRGVEPARSKGEQDTSCLIPPPPSALRGLLSPFQSKQSAGQSPRGLEDLDILVEVLQEDLKRSQRREQPPLGQGSPRDPRSCQGEPGGSEGAAGGLRGGQDGSSDRCPKDFHPILRGEQPSSSDCCPKDFHPKDFHTKDFHPKDFHPIPGSPRPGEQPSPISFTGQDLSALSFFQFQLHREENLLRNIPEEKLLAPDENGNRLLHKAVAQGKRALTFALAQKFASLNKIDEKDAEERTALHLAAEKNQHLMVSDLISLGANVNEQDSSGKTPLHLCAEKGYLRVLEVLKNCKTNGICVEVDLPDRNGLTPLHRAALAHTVLVAKSQRTAPDSDLGRLLSLRRSQILEGIQCLLQM
ncbi:IKBZ inhibitor, partial [Malurus elegans]|nr:IKBZ inhibitor [Malurus elegans]